MVRRITGKYKGQEVDILVSISGGIVEIADLELNKDELLAALGAPSPTVDIDETMRISDASHRNPTKEDK